MTEVKFIYVTDLVWTLNANFSWLETPESIFWPLEDSRSRPTAPPAGKDPTLPAFSSPHTDIMLLFVSTLTTGRVIFNPSNGSAKKILGKWSKHKQEKHSQKESRRWVRGAAACSGARDSGLVGKSLPSTTHGSVCVHVENKCRKKQRKDSGRRECGGGMWQK